MTYNVFGGTLNPILLLLLLMLWSSLPGKHICYGRQVFITPLLLYKGNYNM